MNVGNILQEFSLKVSYHFFLVDANIEGEGWGLDEDRSAGVKILHQFLSLHIYSNSKGLEGFLFHREILELKVYSKNKVRKNLHQFFLVDANGGMVQMQGESSSNSQIP